MASSMVGTTVEWYDFFLYGMAAGIVFNKLFFPSEDPVVGTLLAFATFADRLRGPARGRPDLRPHRRPDRAQEAPWS